MRRTLLRHEKGYNDTAKLERPKRELLPRYVLESCFHVAAETRSPLRREEVGLVIKLWFETKLAAEGRQDEERLVLKLKCILHMAPDIQHNLKGNRGSQEPTASLSGLNTF